MGASSRSTYNAVAIAALVCGTAVSIAALVTGSSVVEVVALCGLFTTIAGTVVGRGDSDD